ncbi:hypothetical protein [Chroococcidiopsis sp.]|uniref:hypothetical protein n=1 Tax=Chroococcidiopsis sp. TaxID=3088168 RepID=UPI003F2A1A3E
MTAKTTTRGLTISEVARSERGSEFILVCGINSWEVFKATDAIIGKPREIEVELIGVLFGTFTLNHLNYGPRKKYLVFRK